MPIYEGYNVTASDREGKKYKATDDDGNEIHFGASGYRVKPGTDAGNSYCARSAGIHQGDLPIGGLGNCGAVRAGGQ
jgi:hypothetical protein